MKMIFVFPLLFGTAGAGEIEGPATVEPGTTVILRHAKQPGTGYLWTAGDTPVFVFDEATESGGNTVCVLGVSRAGRYQIQLIESSCAEGVPVPTIRMIVHDVLIGDVAPGPDPSPVPTPVPIPPAVDTIANAVRDMARLNGDKFNSAVLSTAFSVVAQRNLATPAEYKTATESLVTSAIAGKKAKWEPFLNGLDVLLESLKASGKLVTAEQHKDVWNRISTGLWEAGK
jgi:hypothetical protein